MEDVCGIYAIVNNKNNKKYIGLSKHCMLRKRQHFNALKKGNHSNIHLQNAFNIHGESSFDFVILELCKPEELAEKEIYWIDYYDSFKRGYNRSGGGDGTANVIFSEERSEKLRKAMTGRKFPQNSGKYSAKARKIVCLNTGKIYECIKYASDELGIEGSSIVGSCKKYTTVGKQCYIFAYYEDYILLSKEEINEIMTNSIFHRQHRNSRKIICLNTLDVFKNAKEAAQYYHTDNSYVNKCCKGLVASAGKDENNNPMTWMNFDKYLLADNVEIIDRIEKCNSLGRHNMPCQVVCVETNETFPNKTEVCKKYKIRRHIFNKGLQENNQYILINNDKKLTFRLVE